MKKSTIAFLALVFLLFSVSAQAESIKLIEAESWWGMKVESVSVGNVDKWLNYDAAKWDALQPELTQAQGAFGNQPNNSANPSTVHTGWSANSVMYLQKVVSSPAEYIVEDLMLNLSVDNGFVMFINGQLVASAYAEGYVPAGRWEYTLSLQTAPWIQGGDNLVQIIALDWGGSTFFDMTLDAGVTPTPVPAAALLLGTGLSGILFMRRKM